ncbi:MAG: chorismate synthase [Salibacteraceae bacterium]
MSGNSFGKLFCLTTYGESHGDSIGGIIDGCPAGLEVDIEKIQAQLNRRKPGQSRLTTQRKESDIVEFQSGIFEGKTLGSPIGFRIENEDSKSKDYSHIKDAFRPNHGDFTWQNKFGVRDYRGGGRSSARETASRVVGGAIAAQLIPHVKIHSYVSAVGGIEIPSSVNLNLKGIDDSLVRCPHLETSNRIITEIEKAKKVGDSLGGIISCVIKNVPVGWGEPVFDKLNANLGKALLSINAVKGIEFGEGFNAAQMKGSEMNDLFETENDKIVTKSNHSGGIQAGISNGQDITIRLAFKPVATIYKDQESVNDKGETIVIKGKGRHDPCVLPRAVPIVDAMIALVLADHYLLSRTNKI